MEIESRKLPGNGNTNEVPVKSLLAAAVRVQVFRSLYMDEGEGYVPRKSLSLSGLAHGTAATKAATAFGMKPERILRIKQVCDITGLAVSTLYRLLKHQQFPQQVRLGPKCVGWRERDIAEWCKTRKPRNRVSRS